MKTTHTLPLIAFLLALGVGCSTIPLPKTITKGDLSPQLKKRRENIEKHFNEQRKFMEAEAAKSRADQPPDPSIADEPDVEGELVGYAAAVAPMPSGKLAGGADHNDFAEINDPKAVEWLRQGRTALAGGYSQTALKCFRNAAKQKPDNPQIPISAAASALRANQSELAITLLTEASERIPKSAAVHRMLGAAYYRSGDFQASQVSLQQSLSLDKSNALSYLLMGCTLTKLGQQEAAEASFRQAQAINPRYRLAR